MNFKNNLIPAIVQDADTNKVLMLAYMNEEAYEKTLKLKKVTFFSRSRQKLWTKGETSGNFLFLVDLKWDCDKDTILIKAKPKGAVCHTGQDTCWDEINQINPIKNEKLDENTNKKTEKHFLFQLSKIIKQRIIEGDKSSYVNQLYNKNINKVAQKVGEEAVELVIEAVDKNNNQRFIDEASDLLFHYLILLEKKEISLEQIEKNLFDRHK